jgi:hypothetical protein
MPENSILWFDENNEEACSTKTTARDAGRFADYQQLKLRNLKRTTNRRGLAVLPASGPRSQILCFRFGEL